MESEEFYQRGLLYLKDKNYSHAVKMFGIVFGVERDMQSFEALYSALIASISESRADNKDYKPELEKIKVLMNFSSTAKEVLGFSYSTINKSKLTKRYKFLALIFHPDKHPENSEYFIKAKSAYDELNSADFKNIEQPYKKFFNERTAAEFEYNDECFCSMNPFLLCSFFPMMMLLFISIYSAFDGFNYGYSNERTLRYTQCTESSKYNIAFCFSPEDVEYFDEIEKLVEQEWLDSLARTCEMQQNRAIHFDPEARTFFPVDLTSCEILKSLEPS